ncbi:hypothetical protein, partial [Escherichia coli]|uniref:hypothetical protein n=1 Tax=Escherichia coli TaxID=562 RepID=UPI001BB1483B
SRGWTGITIDDCWKGWAILPRQKQKKLIMLPSETMIWQPEFTDKTLSRKPGAVQVLKSAVQNVDGKDVVFVATQHGQKVEFTPQPVKLGQSSGDSQWIEVVNGLNQGQKYAAQGSFLLKSEMEKGEASHEH